MNKNNDKPKIGCLTFHRAINYGALLQTYALQEVFRKFGCEYTVIDYRSPCLEKRHKEMNIHDCKTLKDILRWIFYSRYHNKKYNKFRDFSSRHLNLLC